MKKLLKKAKEGNRFQVLFNKYSYFTMIPPKVFEDNLRLISEHSLPKGDVVECGVWRGGMSAAMAEVLGKGRHYHLFDSFEGLPDVKEEDGQWAKQWKEEKDLWYFNNCEAEEEFAQKAMELAKCTQYVLHKGWFRDTLLQFQNTSIALLRLDGDWYDSTYQCLEHLYPKVADGGLVIIDDYYAWEGCIRALYDYFSKNHITDRIRSTTYGVCYLIKNEPFPFGIALQNRSIPSPLSATASAKLVDRISGKFIKKLYQQINIDVETFKEDDDITVYACEETGYRFYAPYSAAGDGFFYEQLQKFPWYYMPWKWEHETVKQRILRLGPNLHLLEIGAAKGSFLEKMSKEGLRCTGLELNSKAIKESENKDYQLLEETIQTHALQHVESYDVVCSFQVMEHIAEIKNALEASVKALKTGGKLFISVPNNASFLGLDKNNPLNYPPHHMGLWDEQSLRSLDRIFKLRLEAIYLEPLQDYHKSYFDHTLYEVLQERYYLPLVKRLGMAGKVAFRLLKPWFIWSINQKYPQLQNFTILAEYTKL